MTRQDIIAQEDAENAKWRNTRLSDWGKKGKCLKLDDKTRKAILAWADANDITGQVLVTKPTFDGKFLDIEYGMLTISFIYWGGNIEDVCNKYYDLDELCGVEPRKGGE